MEISGQRLFFPPNFKFFHRLPARFEILVIARGANKQGSTVFEVEISGQRLALPSRVALIPGKRYELEKISELEFRIVREKEPTEKEAGQELRTRKSDEPPAESTHTPLSGITPFSLGELALLRLLEEGGKSVRERNDKYVFDFSGEFELRGLFHPHRDGGYTLFISGVLAAAGFPDALSDELKSLGIRQVRILDNAVFDRLAAGAVDLRL
jgi:hypothetical protein